VTSWARDEDLRDAASVGRDARADPNSVRRAPGVPSDGYQTRTHARTRARTQARTSRGRIACNRIISRDLINVRLTKSKLDQYSGRPAPPSGERSARTRARSDFSKLRYARREITSAAFHLTLATLPELFHSCCLTDVKRRRDRCLRALSGMHFSPLVKLNLSQKYSRYFLSHWREFH